MTVELYLDDLLPFAPNMTQEQADTLITGTLARVAVSARCILDPAFPDTDAARDIVLAGVLRRFVATGGSVTTETIGPYSVSVDNRASADQLFTASEMAELHRMCREFAGAPRAGLASYAMPDSAPVWPDPAVPARGWYLRA